MRYMALVEGSNFLLPGEMDRVGFFATLSIEVSQGEDVVEGFRQAGIRKIAELGLINKENWMMRSCCVIKKIWLDDSSFDNESSSGASFFKMGVHETLSATVSRIFSVCFQRKFIILV